MKIIPIEQSTPEWHAWRKTKITATSAGILMDHNPWEKPLDLWNSMLGFTPPKEKTAAMQRGNDLEPEARLLFIERTGIEMIPICCECSDNPWMAASLDGWSQDNGVVLEIKSPNEKTHLMALDGEAPLYYHDQMMHQLKVTGGTICYYVSYRPEYKKNPLAIVETFPHIEYMDQIVQKESHFYHEYFWPSYQGLSTGRFDMIKRPEAWSFKQKSYA